eukprot:365486-Chlamydomonas_euryale.AAC.16
MAICVTVSCGASSPRSGFSFWGQVSFDGVVCGVSAQRSGSSRGAGEFFAAEWRRVGGRVGRRVGRRVGIFGVLVSSSPLCEWRGGSITEGFFPGRGGGQKKSSTLTVNRPPPLTPGASVLHGFHALGSSHAVGGSSWAFAVLAVSAVLEGYSLLVAMRSIKEGADARGMSFLEYVGVRDGLSVFSVCACGWRGVGGDSWGSC